MTSSIMLFIAVALLVTFLVRHLRQQTRVERNARTETERQLRQAQREAERAQRGLERATGALEKAQAAAEKAQARVADAEVAAEKPA